MKIKSKMLLSLIFGGILISTAVARAPGNPSAHTTEHDRTATTSGAGQQPVKDSQQPANGDTKTGGNASGGQEVKK